MNDEQKEFLTLLNAGEAIVYSAGWHEAVRVQVHSLNDTNAPEIDVEIIKQLGQQRMFAQRKRLYPNLSGSEDWNAIGVETFNQYIIDATKFLNLMIRWVMSPSVDWVNRITHSFNDLKRKYPSISHAQALHDLFKDIAPVSTDKKYTDGLTVYQLYDILLKLVINDRLPVDPKSGENFPIEREDKRPIWNDISLVFKQIQSI